MITQTEIRRRIYGRLDKLSLKDQKDDIVAGFTSGRTTHLRELTEEESMILLEKLGGHVSIPGSENWGRFSTGNKQHMYILSLCQQIGWVSYNIKLQRNTADVVRLGKWIANFGAIKKPLLQMTTIEVQKIITQLEQILIKHHRAK